MKNFKVDDDFWGQLSMRYLNIFLCLGALLSPAVGRAAVVSNTTISPGQSVTIDFSNESIAQLNFDGVVYVPPGDQVSYQVYDYSFINSQSVDGPGSEQSQIYATSSICSLYSMCGPDVGNYSSLVLLTYDHPGTYQVNYSYRSDASWYGQYSLTSSDGSFDGAGPTGGVSSVIDAGSFTVTVAAVPELTTWAMIIVGLCGLGFIARSKKQPGAALSAA